MEQNEEHIMLDRNRSKPYDRAKDAKVDPRGFKKWVKDGIEQAVMGEEQDFNLFEKINIMDGVVEAQRILMENHIKANTLFIRKGFVCVKEGASTLKMNLMNGGEVIDTNYYTHHYPMMVFGMDAYFTDELPEGYAFMVARSEKLSTAERIKNLEYKVQKSIPSEWIEEYARNHAEKYPIMSAGAESILEAWNRRANDV